MGSDGSSGRSEQGLRGLLRSSLAGSNSFLSGIRVEHFIEDPWPA
jgi:hypothetical protein